MDMPDFPKNMDKTFDFWGSEQFVGGFLRNTDKPAGFCGSYSYWHGRGTKRYGGGLYILSLSYERGFAVWKRA